MTKSIGQKMTFNFKMCAPFQAFEHASIFLLRFQEIFLFCIQLSANSNCLIGVVKNSVYWKISPKTPLTN